MTITKVTAEAAVSVGAYALASFLLVPIRRNDLGDPEALGIQAHMDG